MESRKSARKLAETIHTLLGWKSHLTSNWVKSVCDIMKSAPPDLSSIDLKPKTDDEMRKAISKIEDELVVLTAHINQLNTQRRKVLNEFLDLRGNIRVFCRIRPIGDGENFGPSKPVAALDSSNVLLKLAENKSKTYSFDKVFHPDSSQDEVFAEIEPVIKSALDGYNACIFAYGQTGTGKSFTMEGTPNSPGVVSRAMEAIFKQAVDSNHVFLFSFSMLEIYLGNLKDLLVPQPTKAMDPKPPCLSIQTDPKGGIEIENLVAIRVTDFNQALRLYKLGCRFRSTASTNSNTKSSRSHCLIRLSITCFNAPERRRETNKIWFIDLGGSERVLKTKASGRRLDEGKAINLSLSALGDVIHALHKKNCHIPYRNSKLTQVLKDSLGEDSKTLMLVHISPKEEDLCETVCSLSFATRARSIHLGNTESTVTRSAISEKKIKSEIMQKDCISSVNNLTSLVLTRRLDHWNTKYQEEKKQREIAITNLEHKMKMIEDERHDARRNIEKLNEELEKLTGKAPPSNGELDASHSSNKLNQNNLEAMKSNTTEVTEAPLSKIPRFMKPTVSSSKRKSAIDYQTFEERVQFPARRRRPLSHRAESVSFPIKRTSDYNSECSISRNSCLVGLNVKSNADDETEYSHDATECDVKNVIFPEQETSSKSSVQQKDCLVDSESYGIGRKNSFRSTNLMKVDNWLRLHKNEPRTSTVSHKSKRVLAISITDKKQTRRGEKEGSLQNSNEHNYQLAKKKIVADNEKLEKCVDVAEFGRSKQEVEIQINSINLDTSINRDFSCDSICPLDIDGETIQQTQALVNKVLMVDKHLGPSPRIYCSNFDSNQDVGQASKIFIARDKNGRLQCSDSSDSDNSEWCAFSCSDNLSPNNNGGSEFSPHKLVHGIVDTREDNDSLLSASEYDLQCPRIPIETGREDNEHNDKNTVDQTSALGLIPGIHNMRSQRALFMANENPKEPYTISARSQDETEKIGICHLLVRKIQILFACCLLALGIQNLGLEHEFFHGLNL